MSSSSYHVLNNLKTGDFIDFQSESGKWFYAKVISIRNTEIELEYITFRLPIPIRCKHNYRKCWIDIRLRCIL